MITNRKLFTYQSILRLENRLKTIPPPRKQSGRDFRGGGGKSCVGRRSDGELAAGCLKIGEFLNLELTIGIDKLILRLQMESLGVEQVGDCGYAGVVEVFIEPEILC